MARIFVCPSENTDAGAGGGQVRRGGLPQRAGVRRVPPLARARRALQGMWDAWAAGDRKAAVAAIPDEVVDELVVHGSPETCRRRIQQYFDNGVTTSSLAILPLDPDLSFWDAARPLAPTAALSATPSAERRPSAGDRSGCRATALWALAAPPKRRARRTALGGRAGRGSRRRGGDHGGGSPRRGGTAPARRPSGSSVSCSGEGWSSRSCPDHDEGVSQRFRGALSWGDARDVGAAGRDAGADRPGSRRRSSWHRRRRRTPCAGTGRSPARSSRGSRAAARPAPRGGRPPGRQRRPADVAAVGDLRAMGHQVVVEPAARAQPAGQHAS